MNGRVERLLESRQTIWWACACSLTLGAFFLFVWSPLPWGWLGIDHYDDRATNLAAGRPFDTTDVPWGYAYYLAAFYRIFGHVPLIPLLGQVLLNATLPWLIYAIARHRTGRQTATLAALLTGLFSFNTIYASTQSSDSVCTVVFAAHMLCYLTGRRSGTLGWFAGAGALAGIAAQFRPNLMLFPLVLAALELLTRVPVSQRIARAGLLMICTGVVLTPWIARNYRLTGEFLPSSTHGGIQLWYGTLQVGPYLESRAHNPRSAFESPPFDYTVLAGRSIVITAEPQCRQARPDSVRVIYWTDREATPQSVVPSGVDGTRLIFDIPGQPASTTVYYYLQAAWPGAPPRMQSTPDGGRRNPRVFFVADSHLTDLDRHDDLLDVFDLVRLLRWRAWAESPSAVSVLDIVRDGTLDDQDLTHVVGVLLDASGRTSTGSAVAAVDIAADAVTLRLVDGSWFRVPRAFSGKVTDLAATGEFGQKLLYSRRVVADLSSPPPSGDPCTYFEHLAANDVFYRKEPHEMRRFSALAFDNIWRDPAAFAAATAYRMLRLFVIRGSDDKQTSQQFRADTLVYTFGTIASALYFLALLAGIVVAARRKMPIWPLVLPIAYVPLTIAPVLTNMRYTLTAQPFAFVFVAIALLTVLVPRPRN